MKSFSEMTIGEFVAMAASDSPVPGGGGIAALAGALGAAMASMAANFTVGKPKYAEHDNLMRQTLATLQPLITDLQNTVEADAEAFNRILAAYKLPKANDEEKQQRKTAIETALTAAMLVPSAALKHCRKAAELLPGLGATANMNLISDVEVAGLMLEAAARAAKINVLANSGQLTSPEARAAETTAETDVNQVAQLVRETFATIAARKNA